MNKTGKISVENNMFWLDKGFITIKIYYVLLQSKKIEILYNDVCIGYFHK